MARMQINVAHGRDGWSLIVYNRPLYKEFVSSAYAWLDGLTGGRLGGNQLPGFMWKIPIGRAKWDYTTFGKDDPLLINSVAGKMYDIWSGILIWGDGQEVAWISIDRDTAYKINPKWVTQIEQWDAEEDAA